MNFLNFNNRPLTFENTTFIKAIRISWNKPNLPINKDQLHSVNQPQHKPQKPKDLISSFEEDPKKCSSQKCSVAST